MLRRQIVRSFTLGIALGLCTLGLVEGGRSNAQASPAAPAAPVDPVAQARGQDIAPLTNEALDVPVIAAFVASPDDSEAHLPRYDLGVWLDPGARTFRVNERLDLNAEQVGPVDELVLQIYANVGSNPPPVTLVGGHCTPTCEIRFEPPAAVIVQPKSPLVRGAHWQVHLELEGRLAATPCEQTSLLAKTLGSLGALTGTPPRGGYGLLAEGERIAVLANFYAVLARRHGPIWERIAVPAPGDLGSDDLANYHATLSVPESYQVITNGAARPGVTSGGRKQVEVHAPAARDFVVVTSDRLQSARENLHGVSIESYFLPEDRAAGEHVLRAGSAALEIYERRFGPYPYKRLALVEAALLGGAGGVEFSGLALLASSLYRAGNADTCSPKPQAGGASATVRSGKRSGQGQNGLGSKGLGGLSGLGGLGSKGLGGLSGLGGLGSKGLGGLSGLGGSGSKGLGGLSGLGGSGSKGLGGLSGLGGSGSKGLGGLSGLGGLDQLAKALGAVGLDLGPKMASMREFVTVHEVAHQWWHALVGSDSREHPFVDESLSQWSSILYWEEKYGPAQAEEQTKQQIGMAYSLMRLAGEPDGPVDRPVTAFSSELAYAGLVYAKGSYLYRELRALLGDESFFRGLRAYVAKYRFRYASPEALFEQWSEGPHAQSVRALVDRWLHQSRGDQDLGAPEISALLPASLGSQRASLGALLERALQGMVDRGR